MKIRLTWSNNNEVLNEELASDNRAPAPDHKKNVKVNVHNKETSQGTSVGFSWDLQRRDLVWDLVQDPGFACQWQGQRTSPPFGLESSCGILSTIEVFHRICSAGLCISECCIARIRSPPCECKSTAVGFGMRLHLSRRCCSERNDAGERKFWSSR